MGCQYCTSGLGSACQGPDGIDALEASCACACHGEACASCGYVRQCPYEDEIGAPLCAGCWKAWQSALGAEDEDYDRETGSF